MKGPWTYKVLKRKNGGEAITLRFDADCLLEFRWYPPWQNQLQRNNAKTICEDLNAAFHARGAALNPERK